MTKALIKTIMLIPRLKTKYNKKQVENLDNYTKT